MPIRRLRDHGVVRHQLARFRVRPFAVEPGQGGWLTVYATAADAGAAPAWRSAGRRRGLGSACGGLGAAGALARRGLAGAPGLGAGRGCTAHLAAVRGRRCCRRLPCARLVLGYASMEPEAIKEGVRRLARCTTGQPGRHREKTCDSGLSGRALRSLGSGRAAEDQGGRHAACSLCSRGGIAVRQRCHAIEGERDADGQRCPEGNRGSGRQRRS